MILKFKTGHSQNQTSCPPIFRSSVISEPLLERFGNQRCTLRAYLQNVDPPGHFGGCNSLFNQPVAASDFRGSGRSQSRHWNVRGPLPPGGSAKTLKAPQPAQVGRSAWPINKFCRYSKMSSIQNRRHSRAFPGVPLKIVGEPAEYLSHFRAAYIGSETAARASRENGLVMTRDRPNALVIRSSRPPRVRARGSGSRTHRWARSGPARRRLPMQRDRPGATARIDRNGSGLPQAAA
jgi:hypothetical protein